MCFDTMMIRFMESCREIRSALKNTNISWRTYGLISVFAVSSWIAVNGIWSELPVLVLYAPEKWNLASYIVVIVQLGNIGPLLFSLANRLRPRIFTEKLTIYVLILIGILSCLFLALFWKKTTTVGGAEHSTALMLLVMTLALVDCSSSVVFLTFMSLYDPRYMTALYIGESFSGLLPGVAALIQGSPKTSCNTTKNHTDHNSTTAHADSGLLFGADIYFVILLAMMLACGLAFLGLNFLPFAKREQEELSINTITDEESEDSLSFTDSDKILNRSPSPNTNQCCESSQITSKHIVLYCMQAIICGFNFGIIPSLSPYALGPYGDTAYHLVSSVGPIGSSVVCFFIIWSKKASFTHIFAGFVIFLSCAIYLVILAREGPTPLLYKSDFGTVIAVLVGVTISMIGTYTRLTISIIMREESKRALYWCGMSIQIGSFVGAFSIFPFVNILHTFHQKYSC